MDICNLCYEPMDGMEIDEYEGERMCFYCAEYYRNEDAMYEDAQRKIEKEEFVE